MRLVRYGPAGAEKPGLLDDQDQLRDLSAHVADVDGTILGSDALAVLKALDPAKLPLVEGQPRLGPCIGNVGKFLCIGLNYSDHAEEAGMAIPAHPIVFLKANSAICGPYDDLILPRGSTATDWEVELGVVIGKRAKYVSASEAMQYVAGYCLCNDVSERDFQLKLSGQWTKGKSCDSFGPLGPWFVTSDQIPDPQALSMTAHVNGKQMQNGSTSTMIFGVAEIIAHLSKLMTLHPGDIISTGTPPGVGMGQKPPVYLKPGDVVEIAIEALGAQRQTVIEDV